MATKKKTAAPTRTGTIRKGSEAAKKQEAARQEQLRKIWSVVIFAAAVILIALLAIPGAQLWESIGDFFLGLFGVASWILVALMIYCSFLLALDVGTKRIHTKIIQTAILACFICAILHTAAFNGADVSYGQALKDGWAQKTTWSGGLLGALVGWLLLRFGKVPALIIEIVAAAASFAIMSGKSIANIIELYRRGREKRAAVREAALENEPESAQILVDGHAIPKEATAKTQMGKKPVRNFDPSAQFTDTATEQIPINFMPSDTAPIQPAVTQEVPPTPEPSPEQLNSLEAALSGLGGKKPVFTQHPLPQTPAEDSEDGLSDGEDDILSGAPIDPEHRKEIDTIAKKATEEVAAQEAKAASESGYKPLKALNYKSPPIDLLAVPQMRNTAVLNDELRQTAAHLVETLKSFNVETRVSNILCGPSVTRYELQLSAGVKISKITNLANDIAMSLAALSVRIEAPIPGKQAIGIEIPNRTISTVCVREVMESEKFCTAKSNLTVALGKDITGSVVVTDLAKMPHLLIAGTTGSGKSVCINTFLISLIYKAKPEDVRLLLIDPKVVELNVYNGIPHLLIPVVTDPKKAAGALAWAVTEMLDRYHLFAAHEARDLAGYNAYARRSGEVDPLPQIVIVIDELSDLMMVARNDVEDSIFRLAQMARAAGMHLVIATQRPSTDVITGTIKANIPSRIAFAVSSNTDSRVIMDNSGAEKLLGRGDMLFCAIDNRKPVRIQGCFVSDDEVERVINYVKNKHEAKYDADIQEQIEIAVAQRSAERGEQLSGAAGGGGKGDDSVDSMMTAAIDWVVAEGKASVSLLQRRLSIGYQRSARIIDELYERGIIGEMDGSKPRPVLITQQQWSEMKMRNGLK